MTEQITGLNIGEKTIRSLIHNLNYTYHQRVPIKRFSNGKHSKLMRQETSAIKVEHLHAGLITVDFDEFGWDGNPKNSKGWIPIFILLV